MTTFASPPFDPRPHELRSVAASIECVFPMNAKLLRAIADSILRDRARPADEDGLRASDLVLREQVRKQAEILARIEALADEWTRRPNGYGLDGEIIRGAGNALRAVLAAHEGGGPE